MRDYRLLYPGSSLGCNQCRSFVYFVSILVGGMLVVGDPFKWVRGGGSSPTTAVTARGGGFC